MNKTPLVMCLTNYVAADFTANALLAIGAKPAMVEEPSEAAELAGKADAVLINLGTVHPRQAEAMHSAISAISNSATLNSKLLTLNSCTPWVLDPVACHLLSYRGGLAAEFVAKKPTLIRGNHAEIDYLMGTVPESKTGTVPLEIRGGVPMLQKITATGCVQGAICAAFLGRGQSPLEAAEHASRIMKRAGELAWERARTPGSFKTALIDALYHLSQDDQ